MISLTLLRSAAPRTAAVSRRILPIALSASSSSSSTARLTYADLMQLQHKLAGSSPNETAAWLSALNLQSKKRLTEAMFLTLEAEQRRELSKLFRDIDKDNNGVISSSEFGSWYASHTVTKKSDEELRKIDPSKKTADLGPRPTNRQLFYLGLRHFVPMLGFGFTDNSIMIIAGESIQNSVGIAFHLSTMASAGLGNLFSDVLGLSLSNSIQALADKMGLPDPKMSLDQHQQTISRRVTAFASVVGIGTGCLLGLTPLIFLE